jgi:26S proteasome regulatory subunit N7
MGPYFEYLVSLQLLPVDKILSKSLIDLNSIELSKIEARLKDAIENLGETEVSDALLLKANHFAKIGDVKNAKMAFDVALEKTGPLGRRIDLLFAQIRCGFFANDVEIIDQTIQKVKRYKTLIID